MKAITKKYIAIWTVLLALFHVITFVPAEWLGQEKYTSTFWVGYLFIIVAFLGQLVCAYIALQKSDIQKLFYSIPLIKISYTGLILSFIFGGLCMLLPAIPYWVGIVLCAIVLACNVISLIKASAAAGLVQRVDEKIESKTEFIKSITVDAELLCSGTNDETVKKECKKVWEALRYSDPMSSPELSAVEDEIRQKFAEFSESVSQGDQTKIAALSEETILLVEQRNKKCRMLK